MSVLKYYDSKDPLIYDIHTYSPRATYSPQVDGVQTGFNPYCQAAAVDFSGVSLRSRSFSRVMNSSTKSLLAIPYVASSINFWNTSNPAAVLISPKHALICQHYRGTNPSPNPGESYTFLGKSGTKYTRLVVRVTLNIGSDHTLLEFGAPIPANDVTYYNNIADVGFVPYGHPLWVHDCQSRAYKLAMDKAGYYNNQTSGYSYFPFKDGINEGATADDFPFIWVGDSGSPTFTLDSAGNTLLVGLLDGGAQINASEIAAINANINPQGYSVNHIKYVYGGSELVYSEFQATAYPFVEVIEPISYERGKALKSSVADFKLNVYSDIAATVPVVKIDNIAASELGLTLSMKVLASGTNQTLATGVLTFNDDAYAAQDFVRYHFNNADLSNIVPGYVFEGYFSFNHLTKLIQAFTNASYGAVLTMEPATVSLFSQHRVNNIYCQTAKPLIAQTTTSKYVADPNPVSGDIKLVAGNNCNISVQSATKTILVSAQRNANDSIVEQCGVWGSKVSSKDILCNEVIYSISGVTPDQNGNVTFDAVAPLVCSSLTSSAIQAVSPEFTSALSSFGGIIRFIYVGLPQSQGNSSVFNCDTGS